MSAVRAGWADRLSGGTKWRPIFGDAWQVRLAAEREGKSAEPNLAKMPHELTPDFSPSLVPPKRYIEPAVPPVLVSTSTR